MDKSKETKEDRELDELLKKVDDDNEKFYSEMDIKKANWTKPCFRYSQVRLDKLKN